MTVRDASDPRRLARGMRRMSRAVDRVIRGDTSDAARRWVMAWASVARVAPRGRGGWGVSPHATVG